MPRPISGNSSTPLRFVIVTLDGHLSSALERVRPDLKREMPGFEISLHAASEWGKDAGALERCRADIASADIIVATMLFMDDHIKAILPALQARRDDCDALVVCISAAEVAKLTRLGRFTMDGSSSGPMSLLKKLRGKSKPGQSAGAQQMAMLRRLPQILRFIPGTAQDVRAYFLTMQYWLSGSDENLVNMVRFLVGHCADGPRRPLRSKVSAKAPALYPETGVYHPRLKQRIAEDAAALPRTGKAGTVGLLVMRAHVLAGDTAHYDAVIAALESRGLNVIPAFASGLDARPAIESFFRDGDTPRIDLLLSLTGFSLVGGPAYNDARAAEDALAGLDVPYIAAHSVGFQSLQEWQASDRGLMPVESTIMVAIPELDGATGPIIFGGRSETATGKTARDMHPAEERIGTLAARVSKLVTLRRSRIAERKVAVVLFNFPPNAGSTGTAAHLSVFESLHNALKAMAARGYTVEVPDTVDALRDAVLNGNAERYGTDANVCHQISADDHVREETWLKEIEAQWGPAPGRQLSDGRSIHVLGQQFGNVLVAVQPGFGYEGDPMRLLFEKGFAPTHAFSAFYRYLRKGFGADAVLHFGTHGALEFMPGKQTGLSAECWPDRLIGDLPNFYLYAGNNPSEGAIAKRRAAATLISYLTPPVTEAGLYKGLIDLKASLERLRALPPGDDPERGRLAELVAAQAAELDIESNGKTEDLWAAVLELEQSLIPHGLHVVGKPMSAEARGDLIRIAGEGQDDPEIAARKEALLSEDHELPALMHALDGGFIRPAPGGDLVRSPDVLPTGRNIHGFDPFRLPSAFAVAEGRVQANLVVERHINEGHAFPESVALVLWGTDNLKSEGVPIAQALALIGAEPRFDGYGRLCGARLVPLDRLGRPRIDVLMTLSGIFRDLLPIQTRMLAEAALLAAEADEPVEQNYVRKHALALMEAEGVPLQTAALRVFSNAEGAYGSNVNQLIDSGSWQDEDELAEAYSRRKCFAYGADGEPKAQPELLQSVLGGVQLAYQNLDSIELGITTLDHYFDTLGGIGRAVKRARGDDLPVYVSDHTHGEGKVRTLSEQVALETRTRVLNPKWFEGMLSHGYEGVRQIEAHVTNTMGWSATTGQVAPWVYQQISQTFLLDEDMRRRMAELNPKASMKVANRLIEAHERNYWQPDAATLAALQKAGEELEDRLEGVAA
ncbi:MAG: magnesium chelatase subunit H [Minwuia sp.]|uniref:magnesium chelatase subunit H n=1 Tax=Minwuia sp. TaxID=2493630 RepID=UPI003A89054F